METEKTICLPDEDLNRIIDGYCQRLQFHLLAVIFWIVCGILLAFHHFISIDPTHFRTLNFSPKKFNVCENELSRLYQLFHLIFLWFSTDITAPAKSPDLHCICFRTTFWENNLQCNLLSGDSNEIKVRDYSLRFTLLNWKRQRIHSSIMEEN